MKRRAWVFAGLLVIVAAGGWGAWQWHAARALPHGIASANGRIEATQVDIATKIPGRVVVIVPHEGDMVEAGAIVARLDAAEIEAELRQGDAEAERARRTLAAAGATLASRQGELTFAEGELSRTTILADKGYAPKARLDQRQQELTTARAALDIATAQVGEAHAAMTAADANVDRLKVLLADTAIRSPVRGRVQHRLIEPGAVLAAGGRILSVLDLSDISMTIFLPAHEAGRLKVGDAARVVLDAAPEYVFPTTVSFVAAEAQFTPKAVETRAEREKLMFRVKLRADPALLESLEDHVKSGLRGVAYVRVDGSAAWPASLAPKLPK